MSFNGTLIYLGSSLDALPMTHIKANTYKITPNQRQDLDSSRNASGVLVRNVLSHMPCKIEIEVASMTNSEMAEFMEFITNRYSKSKERKIHVKYYATDTDSYQEGEFYIPDISYTINKVIGKTIYYNGFSLKLIEY